MSKEDNLTLLMILITSLALIDSNDQTKSISMFRRKIRKKLTAFYHTERDLYMKCVKRADDVWERTVEEMSGERMKITVYDIVTSIHVIIADEPLTKKFYTEKQMDSFLSAMKHNSNIDDDTFAETERNVNKIVDGFVDKLGIKRDNKLKLRFAILKQNAIIDKGYSYGAAS